MSLEDKSAEKVKKDRSPFAEKNSTREYSKSPASHRGYSMEKSKSRGATPNGKY